MRASCRGRRPTLVRTLGPRCACRPACRSRCRHLCRQGTWWWWRQQSAALYGEPEAGVPCAFEQHNPIYPPSARASCCLPGLHSMHVALAPETAGRPDPPRLTLELLNMLACLHRVGCIPPTSAATLGAVLRDEGHASAARRSEQCVQTGMAGAGERSRSRHRWQVGVGQKEWGSWVVGEHGGPVSQNFAC